MLFAELLLVHIELMQAAARRRAGPVASPRFVPFVARAA